MANWIPEIQYGSPTTTLNFTYPPERDPFNEDLKANVKVTKSNDGTEQVQYNYTEEMITVNFVFLTKAELDSLRTFYEDHAALGNTFTYLPSDDEVTSYTYSLADYSFKPKRVITNGVDDFFYDVKMKFRRVK